MATVQVNFPLPQDEDGFFRRECPNCEREFKVIAEQRPDSDAPRTAGDAYFYPYCAVSAGAGSFWTKAQLEYIKGTVMHQALGPELKKLSNTMKDLERHSNSFVKFKVTQSGGTEAPEKLVEPNDMLRVDPPCHPEPIKVAADWASEIACLICGTKHKLMRAH